jgi:hypothetical protein
MTKKDNNDEIEDSKNQKGFFGKILVIILLIVVAIYLFYQNKNEQISDDQKLSDTKSEQNSQDSKNDVVDDAYVFGPEPPIISFGPTIAEIEEHVAEVKNPYEAELESKEPLEVKSSMAKEPVMVACGYDVKQYEDYLTNANLLLAKYIAGKNYKAELETMLQNKFPQEFDEVLIALSQYSNLENNSSNEITLFNSKLFSKFIKITKEERSAQKAELQEKIKYRIGDLMDYISSKKMQKQFGQ